MYSTLKNCYIDFYSNYSNKGITPLKKKEEVEFSLSHGMYFYAIKSNKVMALCPNW